MDQPKNTEEKELRKASSLTNNWSELLLLMEFAFNIVPNTNTGIFLFFYKSRVLSEHYTCYSEYNIVSFYTYDFVVNQYPQV